MILLRDTHASGSSCRSLIRLYSNLNKNKLFSDHLNYCLWTGWISYIEIDYEFILEYYPKTEVGYFNYFLPLMPLIVSSTVLAIDKNNNRLVIHNKTPKNVTA